MIPDFIPDNAIRRYNDYGAIPFYNHTVKNVTIGAVALNDSSEGLHNKYWGTYFDDGTDNVIVEDIDAAMQTVAFNEPAKITNIALAFDQNANDNYAYITGIGELRLRWFNATLPGYETLMLGQAQSVTLTMDMKYYPSSAESDILLFYIRDGAIYFRAQRDQYATEYVTPITEDASELIDSGMRTDYRFQLRWKK